MRAKGKEPILHEKSNIFSDNVLTSPQKYDRMSELKIKYHQVKCTGKRGNPTDEAKLSGSAKAEGLCADGTLEKLT